MLLTNKYSLHFPIKNANAPINAIPITTYTAIYPIFKEIPVSRNPGGPPGPVSARRCFGQLCPYCPAVCPDRCGHEHAAVRCLKGKILFRRADAHGSEAVRPVRLCLLSGCALCLHASGLPCHRPTGWRFCVRVPSPAGADRGCQSHHGRDLSEAL